jgi:carbonic anhydrase
MWELTDEHPFSGTPGAGSRFRQNVQVARRPHTLLVTCAGACGGSTVFDGLDSQEVQLLRIPANVVPPAWAAEGRVSRTLERAVISGVKDVVICGHSLCKALEERLGRELASAPQSAPVTPARKGRSQDFLQNMFHKMRAAAVLLDHVRENVVTQLRNLESYPAVARAAARGDLRLHGWVYLDQSGLILAYDFERHEFVPLAEHPDVPTGLGV